MMDSRENAKRRAEYWKAEKLAADVEIERLHGIATTLSVIATKWCKKDHHDWQRLLDLAGKL